MAGLLHPSTLQKLPQSLYLFLDIHDTVIQGLIHFTRQPEIGHSPFDTFDLWLYILNLGFPRERGYYTKFYHESPPKPGNEKTLFDEGAGSASSDDGEEEEDGDGSGGIMIEVWKVEGYYARAQNGGSVWVTTKNEVILLLFCHASSWDTIEMPISRLKKELRENVIPVSLSLPLRLTVFVLTLSLRRSPILSPLYYPSVSPLSLTPPSYPPFTHQLTPPPRSTHPSKSASSRNAKPSSPPHQHTKASTPPSPAAAASACSSGRSTSRHGCSVM